jgi:hypothetical protein
MNFAFRLLLTFNATSLLVIIFFDQKNAHFGVFLSSMPIFSIAVKRNFLRRLFAGAYSADRLKYFAEFKVE